jgi:hypothetical protein
MVSRTVNLRFEFETYGAQQYSPVLCVLRTALFFVGILQRKLLQLAAASGFWLLATAEPVKVITDH